MEIKGSDIEEPHFHDRDSFEAWLKDKPREWGVVLARRVVFRISVWCLAADNDNEGARAKFHVLRANFIIKSAGANQTQVRAAANAAETANSTVNEVYDAYAAYAAYAAKATYLASSATYIPSVATHVSNAMNAAATAANEAVYDAIAADPDRQSLSLWQSVRADALVLLRTQKPHLLSPLPLWPDSVPNPVVEAFENARNKSIDSPSWRFWLAWYRCVLLGESTDSVIDSKIAEEIALQETSYWEENEPDVVMAHVVKMAGWDPDKNPVLPLPDPEADKRAAVEELLRLAGVKASAQKPSRSSGATKRKSRIRTSTSRKKEPPAPTFTDRITTQPDMPASEDELGRDLFAQALERQIRDLQQEQGEEGQGFAANIHAPWGAGKSSVLNLLRDRLMNHEDREKRWLVVDFNAWEHEHRKPPWWPLVDCVYCGTRSALFRSADWPRAVWMRGRWLGWRAISDWLPATTLVLLFGLFWGLGLLGFWQHVGSFLGFLAVAVPVVVAVLGVVRGAVFGSPETARAFISLRDNPLSKLSGIFRTIVKIANRPVCVFIDDLDRCNADYVVDLLEGIQTAFRGSKVVYVVAADRQWIKAAFEARYIPDFEQVQEVGQPLGYMFLEKVFQVSAPLPSVPSDNQLAYWNSRLEGADANEGEEGAEAEAEALSSTEKRERSRKALARAQAVLEERVKDGDVSLERVKEVAREGGNTPEFRLAAASKYIGSDRARKDAEHRLKDLGPLIPFNPRAMKRMMNAYTLRVSDGITVNEAMTPERLARWVILEQSYPELADILAAQPELVRPLLTKNPPSGKTFDALPDEIKPYVKIAALRALLTLSKDREPLAQDSPARLTVETVRLFTQGMR